MKDPLSTDEVSIRDFCRSSSDLYPEVHDMLLRAADEIERMKTAIARIRFAVTEPDALRHPDNFLWIKAVIEELDT